MSSATAKTKRPEIVAQGFVRMPTGVRLYYERAGAGHPVVLLHGIAHSSAAWRRVMVPLAEDHDVIALDLPGCGRSDKPDTDYSLGAQAAAVRYALEALDVDHATLIGHSLGGGVAMTYAYHYPERVGRLGLVASGGLGRDLHPIFRLATLPVVPDGVMRVLFQPRMRPLRTAMRVLAARAGADPFFFAQGEYREEMEELLTGMEDPAAQRAFRAMLRSSGSISGQAISALDRLGVASFPVLVVWGREDRVFPVDHAERAAGLLADCRLVVLDDCGHFPQLEATSRFIDALRTWLAETTPRHIDVSMLLREAQRDGG